MVKKKSFIEERMSTLRIVKPGFYFGPFSRMRLGSIYINRKRRNLVFTLTDLQGKVLASVSSGLFKIQRRKRVSPQATEVIVKKLADCAKFFRITRLSVVIRIRSKFLVSTVIRILKSYKLIIPLLYDRIAIAHNGCRRRKLRRL
jgi:ribosomal protein S11